MEYMTDRACVVEYSEGSCCGFLWNKSWVITHATFLVPLLVKNNLKVDQLEDFIKNKDIKVLLPAGSEPISACVSHIWKAEKFSSIILRLLQNSAGWKFNDLEEKQADGESSVEKEYKALVNLLPYFVLLKPNTATTGPDRHLTDIQISSEISLGQRVHITSTPFASVCPRIFFNSVVQGTVSQVVEDTFILTDAKCLPATEGSPVYTVTSKGASLLGVVVAPLVWRHSEWLGLSVVCSATDVLNSLYNKHSSLQKVVASQTTQSIHSLPEVREFTPVHSPSLPSTGHHLFTSPAVVLVHTLMSWGSGVLIHTNYILTCGHVVGNNKTVRVRQGIDSWQKAQVIYSSGSTAVYDLALLYIDTNARHFISQVADPQQGQSAVVIGHGVFGEEHKLTAMITAGVVSKVLHHHQKPVLFQTSCTVQNGASGGAVVNQDGHLLGIVTSNAKDQASKTCYPHLNMAVPAVTVWPIIQQYINTKDSAVLNKLLVQDEHIQDVWLLKPQRRKSKKNKSKL